MQFVNLVGQLKSPRNDEKFENKIYKKLNKNLSQLIFEVQYFVKKVLALFVLQISKCNVNQEFKITNYKHLKKENRFIISFSFFKENIIIHLFGIV